uniref:phosphogluconate dehydrogenase (NADP(+)-dependent, decarboxylating) n=1 Tax=Culex pipiens TaxID=7175 RepID=A0A8D8EWS0_CULPI
MWHGGCIIRSVFLGNIRNAFVRNPAMSHLLLDNFFKNDIVENQQSWREVVSRASQCRSCSRSWASSMAIARSDCPRICCRPSGTTLGRTRTSCLAKRSSLCTKTGPARASTFPLVLCDEHDAAG